MRVLHLTTHLNPGGITIYVLRLIKALRNIGIDISVASSGGSYTHLFHERHAETYEFPFRTKSELNPKIYAAIPQLKALIKNQKIDVIHAHTRITQVMAYWIQKSIGIPVVTTCHGFYKRRLGRRIVPAWGDRVIAISHGVAEHLAQDHKVPPKKIKMIYNAVDFEEITALFQRHDPCEVKKSFGFDQNTPVVGVIARLVEDKGHEYLIRAFSLLKGQYSRVCLLIVGDGPYKKNLEKLVTKMNLHDRVVFTGNVVDVTRPLTAMDLFVFPATWREGFGLSIVEAMACRKPVVVTNVWALNSIIQHGENGMLVEPKKVEPLAEIIIKLLEDRDLREKIENNAWAMANQYFSITRMAKEVQLLYEEVLSVCLTARKSCL